jgi:hypothetical protein
METKTHIRVLTMNSPKLNMETKTHVSVLTINTHKFDEYSLNILDNATQITIEAIWKELVKECIDNSKSYANSNVSDEDWFLVKRTKISEPFWGKVVNH